jgi:hypothetical protein
MWSLAERALGASLVAGGVASLLWMAESGIRPVQRPLSFGLALWPWLTLLYLLILGAVLGAVAVLARWRSLERWPERGLSLLCLVLLALACPSAVQRLAIAAVPLAALAASAFARPVWPRRVLTVAALVVLLAALWPRGASRAEAPPPRPVRAVAPPLLVIGLDGADWDWIEPLLARGELPNIAALRARGAWGVLHTRRPTLSPILWTTIATGRSAEHHGIEGFAAPRLLGVRAPLPKLASLPGLGTGVLLGALTRWGGIVSGPVSSDARRVPAIWNLATREGVPMNVVDWWVTWPAETVLGNVVSEALYYRPLDSQFRSAGRVTYPEDLAGRLQADLVRPDDVSIDEVRRFLDATPQQLKEWRRLPPRQASIEAQICYFLAVAENDRRVALRLTREGRDRFGQPPDLMVLFRLIDMVGHTSLRFSELVPDHLGASADELRRYGRVVSEAYRTLDRSIGELLAAFGPAANVLVVSDHGFELQSHAPENIPSYDHRNGASGILLAAGPGFRPGRTDQLSILDLLPLMVELKGLPLADNLDGRPGALTMGPLFVPPGVPRRVASYGERPVGPSAGAARDDEASERLRALGYVQ